MSEKQNLSSLIWGTADDVLRGMFKPSEYGRIILPFVVLRRLDCVLEPQKDKAYELYEKYKKDLNDPTSVIQGQLKLPFFNYSKYDLLGLKSDPNNVYKNFENYINGYSKNVLDIIENFQIEPLVTKLNKNKKLYLLIDKFTEFDLHPNKIDNHQMGSLYEELLRRFSEMSNEESGDHFTPRDIVKLLVGLVFSGDKENLKGEGKIRSIYDPCCGTGGMLTIGKEWIKENINKDLKIELFGQELNDATYAICKSDFLMSDENPENIKGPLSSLSNDGFPDRKFDYMITNPPFGVSWKSEKEFIEQESKDVNGRFSVGTPRTSDGSLLFLQHLIHKMEPNGSKIGIIFNGSPLFVGDAGSGESEIRRWIVERDLLETIIMLPDRLFFNTGITIYIWLLNNKKHSNRKNKIQLINAKNFYKYSKNKLGEKSKEISNDDMSKILEIYSKFEENKYSKIYSNDHFKYTRIIIDQFLKDKDNNKILDKKNNPKIDKNLRGFERVPDQENIDEYINREVAPNIDEFFYDHKLNKIGYELSLTKEFYEFKKLRNLDEISKDLDDLEIKIKNLEKDIEF
jgi:type I restriction enzyme M protein